MTQKPSPLTIYKASAGSGKTFTLAVEYIKLLIIDPQNFRYTLAVTFTNKATEEMKARILSKLYGIAHSLPDADDYFKQVSEAFPEKSERLIRATASEALELLIHNYHYFRVETIDSFFQSVLRNLAHELGLAANLSIGLNNREVEGQAVDNIISNIHGDNDPLLTWMMSFIQEKIQDNKNWNVIGDIKAFGESIFKDFYKDYEDQLRALMDNPHFFTDYKAKLSRLRATALKQMKDLADRYEGICASYDLNDKCFYQGSKSAPSYFKRLASGAFTDGKGPNTYITAALTGESPLWNKRASAAQQTVIDEQVVPLIREAEDKRETCVKTINSVELTLGNLNELRLLGRIDQEVNDINERTGNFLLSNTQQLLHRLIDGQDTPFIYEKIGGRLRYIMIDEFQDTSLVQWQNFKVLLDDCIAHDRGSLIVGDVKQSIYRWRGGDWRLLQSLTAQKTALKDIKTLGTNYRSERNIVCFNNAFFWHAARLTAGIAVTDLTEKGLTPSDEVSRQAAAIETTYDDVVQKVPDKKKEEGSITVRLLPHDDYDDRMIQQVKDTVEQLLSQGTPPHDIAVLVRKNKFIEMLAEWFQQNPITVNGQQIMAPMVSDEAFRLDASLAVNVITGAMRVLINPTDSLAVATLVKAYHKVCLGDEQATDTQLFVGREQLSELLPREMTEQRDELLATPVIDLAERLYKIFNLNRLSGQSAYLCAFFDQLSKFLQKHVAGIREFLKEWDDNLCGKSIHSDKINGIRLLTIHKSKGLEFNHVIIPWCDWEIEKNGDILWARPTTKPYNELPIVPLRLSKTKLIHSIYCEDYQQEHLKSLVDNLNMLYVAFTRASRNLYVFGAKDKPQYPSQLIRMTLDDISSLQPPHLQQPATMEESADDGTVSFHYGAFAPSKKDVENETENIFEQQEKGRNIVMENYETHVRFRQSNASSDFVLTDEELRQKQERQQYITTGNILHSLFASIHDSRDLDKAISQLEFDGVLYGEAIDRDTLRATIANRLSTPEVRRWFDPHWQVFNECAILTYDDEAERVVERRPDRVIYDGHEMVVIDFKTGAESPKHQQQVQQYMSLLTEMGYPQVSGYLWYIHTNRIIPVKPL